MHRTRLALIALLPLSLGCRSTAAPRPAAEPLRAAYGVDRFEEITGLRYTFNARLGSSELARSWEWEPKSGRVLATRPDQPLEATVYFRGPDGVAESSRAIDAQFINDQYWLLFPLHVVRDGGVKLIDGGEVESPIEGEPLRQLTVQYGTQGGYTPGDAYDLYLDGEGLVQEWVYRREGGEAPTRSARWSDPVELGPLRASLEFDGPDPQEFRIWFTDVEVRVAGEDAWRAVE